MRKVIWPQVEKKRFSVITPDGIGISIDQAGSGEVTCVFLHGLADGSYVWDQIRDAIGPFFCTIAIDLRGHGASDWAGAGRYNLHDYVSDVEFVLASLNMKSYILVGHSLGASIVARVWPRVPVGLRAVILVDLAERSDPEMFVSIRERIRSNYREYKSTEEYRDFLHEAQPLITASAADRLARSSLVLTSRRTLRPRFDVDIVDNDFAKAKEWLPQFSMCTLPVLFVRGAGSAVLSKSQAEIIRRRLPCVTIRTVSRAGHAVMSDNPSEFQSVIMSFLQNFGNSL